MDYTVEDQAFSPVYDVAPSPFPPLPFPSVSSTDDTQEERERETTCLGGGGGGVKEPNLTTSEKPWSSIIH